MINNKYIKKAEKELEELNNDEAEREMARRLADGELDYKWGLSAARENGIEQEKENIAKKMLEKGFELEMIIEVTGLTKEKIQEIKNNL